MTDHLADAANALERGQFAESVAHSLLSLAAGINAEAEPEDPKYRNLPILFPTRKGFQRYLDHLTDADRADEGFDGRVIFIDAQTNVYALALHVRDDAQRITSLAQIPFGIVALDTLSHDSLYPLRVLDVVSDAEDRE